MTVKIEGKGTYDGRELDDGLKGLKSTFTELNSGLELAGKAIGLVTGAMSIAIGHATKWAQASAAAQQAQTRLASVTGTHFAALQKLNTELQRKLGIDDDDLANVQSKLRALGVQTSQLERATKATIGYSEATGKDLLAATKQVATAFKKGGDEVARLAGLFHVAEDAANTFTGETRRLRTLWGELDETLGDSITKSSGLKEAMETSAIALTGFINIFGNQQGQLIIDFFFRKIAGGLSQMINAVIGAKKFIEDTFPDSGTVTDEDDEVTRRTLAAHGLKVPAPGELARNRARRAQNFGDPSFVGPPSAEQAGVAAAKAASVAFWEGLQRFADGLTATGGGAPRLLEPPKVSTKGGGGGAGKGGTSKSKTTRSAGKFGILPGDQPFQADNTDNVFTQAADEAASFDEFADATIERVRTFSETLQEAAAFGISSLGGLLSGAIQEIVSGSGSLLDAIKHLFGSLLITIGEYIIQLGAAAVIGGVLGTAVPWLGVATGGPGAIVAGSIAVAAGGGIVALGAALGGSGKGGGSSKPDIGGKFVGFKGRGGVGSSGGSSSVLGGFTPAPLGAGSAPIQVNINFNRPVTDPRRTARELRQALTADAILRRGP